MNTKNAKNLGMHWAAIRDSLVIAVIPMRVPDNVDFEAYRQSAIATLELLGEVRAGEVFDDYGERCFVSRRNHANRSKAPQPANPLPIYQPPEVYNTGGNL